MGDLERTGAIGGVTPVLPSNDNPKRKPAQPQRPPKRAGHRATPGPRDAGEHKVDDYA